MARKLYVGNLPFSCTEEELHALFSKHGTVISVNLITDRATGRPRGFGFVEMEDPEKAMAELDGFEFEGRALKVNEAHDKPKRGPGGGGGDRGGNWR